MQNQCPRADKQYYSWLLMTGINQKTKENSLALTLGCVFARILMHH
uniref:Uncharacterized protein n=1 Tax=Anguilla anguilla TaxID=7936 RepID=A0A0E9VPB7_ANGAN